MAGLHALEVGVRFARLLRYGSKDGVRAETRMGSGSARSSPAEPSVRLPPNDAIKVIADLISSAAGGIRRKIWWSLVEPFERRMRREQAFRQMLALNDHQLRDIGRSRLDIQAAAMGIYGASGYEMISPDPDIGDGAVAAGSAACAHLRSSSLPTGAIRTSVPVTAKRRWTYRAARRHDGVRVAHPRPKTVSVVAAGRRG